jgi:nucleoside-diphosphate-sugar epimerase
MFVVTGASGRIGRKVIHELVERGVEPDLIVGYAKVTKDVEELAGRPAQPFEDLLGEIKEQMQKMTPGPKTGRMPR